MDDFVLHQATNDVETPGNGGGDDKLEQDGDPLEDGADPLGDTEDMRNEPNRIKCSNLNLTDSVPITAIPEEDNVQGKFILCTTTAYQHFSIKNGLHRFISNIN